MGRGVRETLHGQGYQSLFLDSHPDDGIPAGAKWEQTLWQRLRQSRGVVVLCTKDWLASPWCVAEAMMAREAGQAGLSPRHCGGRGRASGQGGGGGGARRDTPDFLKDTQFISLAGVSEEEALQRLWRGLEEEGLKDDFPLPERPYPGLEPFQETRCRRLLVSGDAGSTTTSHSARRWWPSGAAGPAQHQSRRYPWRAAWPALARS